MPASILHFHLDVLAFPLMTLHPSPLPPVSNTALRSPALEQPNCIPSPDAAPSPSAPTPSKYLLSPLLLALLWKMWTPLQR